MKTPEERALLDIQNKNKKLRTETYILVEKSVDIEDRKASDNWTNGEFVDVKNFGALIQGVVNAVVNGGLDALESSIGSLVPSGDRKILNLSIINELSKQVELLDLAMMVYERNCPAEMLAFYEELEKSYESYRSRIINGYGMKESAEVQKLIETMSQQTGTSRSSPTQVSISSVNFRRKNQNSVHLKTQNSVFSNNSGKSNNFSPTSFNHDGFSPDNNGNLGNAGNHNTQNSSILSEGAKLVNEATKIGATKIVNSMLRRTDTIRLKDSKWRKKLKKIGETLNKNKESVRQAHSSISLNFNGLSAGGDQVNGNRLSLNNAQYQLINNQVNNQVNSSQTSISHVNNNQTNNLANNSITRNNFTNSNFGSTGKLPSREKTNSNFYRPSSTKDVSNPILPSKPSLPPKTVKQINTN